MRLCRIMPTYPTNIDPGIGLPGYYLLTYLKYPTLVITRWRAGKPVNPPSNVKLIRVPYPDVSISNRKGLSLIISVFLKLVGYLIFCAISIFPMLIFRPKIVHIHTPIPIFHGLLARYLLGSKVFVTFHGTDINAFKNHSIVRQLVSRMHRICYVSKPMEETLIQNHIPRKQLLYTPSGVDTENFTPASQDRETIILMVGSLRWQKGYPDALNAFKIFNETHPTWKMYIVGTGPLLKDLILITKELELTQHVNFLGSKSRHEVSKLMQQASIFLLSSVTEGFPKVILEAAASGTPQVVTDVGSCNLVSTNSIGKVVSVGDTIGISNAISDLIDNPQIWREASLNGPKMASTYSWNHTSNIIEQSYFKELES